MRYILYIVLAIYLLLTLWAAYKYATQDISHRYSSAPKISLKSNGTSLDKREIYLVSLEKLGLC